MHKRELVVTLFISQLNPSSWSIPLETYEYCCDMLGAREKIIPPQNLFALATKIDTFRAKNNFPYAHCGQYITGN